MTRREELRSAEVGPIVRHERQRAARALLRQAIVVAPTDHFTLIRRHTAWLREWFWREPGWRLVVETEFARLKKAPADLSDGTRPARDRNGTPFTRRRYVLFCLALAVLERSDRQTTLDQIARGIAAAFSSNPIFSQTGLVFELEMQACRRDLVVVIRFLLDRGVLARVEGKEDQFISHKSDVLYDIERPILASFLCVSRGPSTIEADDFSDRIEAMTSDPLPDTEDARNRALRCHLVRRLLEDPVVYYEDLSTESREYFRHQRPRLLKTIEDATGLVPEARREGIAMVDELDDLTDLRMPEQGTDGHHALLIAEFLATRLRADATARVGRVELESHTAQLIARHRSHWRRDVGETGSEARLTAQTLQRLAALSLVKILEDGVIEPRPAIARYAIATPESPTRELELFE